MKHHQESRPRSRGIYLLPNLFTTAALFSGFYAIIAAMEGAYESACQAIFIALIMDGLDGRVARLTRTQSAFGAEYDSLSDMAAFGVAPAVMAYNWCLAYWGPFGWLLAFFYTATTALRLARFNTQPSSLDKRYFQGLPCPSAAACVASIVWVFQTLDLDVLDLLRHSRWYQVSFGTLLFLMGTLMVSRVRYYSFKEIDCRQRVSFLSTFILLLGFVLIGCMMVEMRLSILLAMVFTGYVLSGPIGTAVVMRKTLIRRREQQQTLGGKPG